MDGWITIGTKLDTNKFDREISRLEKEIEKKSQERINIKAQIDYIRGKANEFNQEIAQRDELKSRLNELTAAQQKYYSLNKTTNAELTMEIKQVSSEYTELNSKIEKSSDAMQRMVMRGNTLVGKFNQLSTDVGATKTKIEGVKLQRQQAEAKQLSENLKQAGMHVGDLAKTKLGAAAQMGEKLTNSFRKTLKTIGKIVIGIIGIRAGLAMVRRASSELGQYDSQYKANIDYIRFALTNAIAPVLRWIVSAVATVLGYINTIFSTLFGINLLGNSSAKAFQNMSAGAGGAAASVKEIKKELAGFDEMNVLSDQDTGGGGGGRRWWYSCTRLRFIRNAT